MIKSMTGFGRCEIAEGDRKITVEMKSVNHRYLDTNIKMPKKLSFFEAAIRNELKNYIQISVVDRFHLHCNFPVPLGNLTSAEPRHALNHRNTFFL